MSYFVYTQMYQQRQNHGWESDAYGRSSHGMFYKSPKATPEQKQIGQKAYDLYIESTDSTAIHNGGSTNSQNR